LLCWQVHCGSYKVSYTVSNMSYLNPPPPLLPFIPCIPDSWNSFNRYHLCNYIHMYTVFAHYSLSYLLSLPPPPPTCAKSGKDLFCSPVLQFCRREKMKRKTWHFCYFEIKIATQGVSLWYFHAYMCYTHNWFVSTNYLHSTYSFSYGGFSQFRNLYIHSCIETISSIFKFLVSFFYPTPPVHDLHLLWPVFHNIAAFVLGLYSTYERTWGFCLS
jgi:hypothetical protein